MAEKVPVLIGISARRTGGSSDALELKASALVPTAGWSDARLVPYVYITPPADGIWDFDLVAERPSGIVLQVVSPIASEAFVSTVPEWFRGARVHASTNRGELTIPLDGFETSPEFRALDIDFPFPFRQGLSVADLIGRHLRVLPPGTVGTFDYREDRVNIFTDDNGTITQVTFG